MRHEYLTADAGRLTRVSKQADGGVVVDHPEVPEALRGLAQVFTEGMITPRTNPDASALPALTAKEVREGCVMPTAEFAVALGRILYLTGEAIAGYEGHDPHGLHLQVGVDIRTLNDGSPSEQHRGPHRIEVHAVGADGLLSSDFHVEFRPVMGGGGVVDPAVVAVSAGLRFYGQARLAAAAQAQGERLAVGDSPFVHMARTALGPRDVLA